MRVELRKWSMADKQALITICNQIDRSYLSDRLPNPYTEVSADWWLHRVEEMEGKCAIFREIVVDGKIIGTISVEQKADVYRKDGEVGYYLLADYSGKGIMSEALRQICELAFQEPNAASRRVLEKNGFVLEGIMKQAVIKDEKIYDLCVYGKIK